MSKYLVDSIFDKIINNDFSFNEITTSEAKLIYEEYIKNTNNGSCKKCIKRSAEKRAKLRIQNLIIKKIKT